MPSVQSNSNATTAIKVTKARRYDTILHEVVRGGHDLAKTTRERYLRDLDAWIEFAGEDPSGWTRKQAQEFYNALITKRRLKPQSANRLMASIQYASRWWAHQENNASLDFAEVREASARDKSVKHSLSQDHAYTLIDSLHNKGMVTCPYRLRDLALIVVGLETGMRRMSLETMTLEETLIDSDQVAERRAPYPLAKTLIKGSNGTRVPIPLSDVACNALRPWRDWLHKTYDIWRGPMFRGLDERTIRHGEESYSRSLVTRPSPHAISATAIVEILRRRCKAAGIPRVNPHMFRHTFITWRADAGFQPHEIAAMTRHSITGLGALGGYFDLSALGAKIRNSTPEWLKELIR